MAMGFRGDTARHSSGVAVRRTADGVCAGLRLKDWEFYQKCISLELPIRLAIFLVLELLSPNFGGKKGCRNSLHTPPGPLFSPLGPPHAPNRMS